MNLVMVLRIVDLLYLEGFIRVVNVFGCRVRLVFFNVMVVCLCVLNIMERFLILMLLCFVVVWVEVVLKWLFVDV